MHSFASLITQHFLLQRHQRKPILFSLHFEFKDSLQLMQTLSGKQIYVAWPHELALLGACTKDRQHTKDLHTFN